MIAEIAGPIHSYLAECGCEDPNFWTAGVLLVFGRLPLTWMRLKKSTREVAERTPFENLSRWKDGAGEVLARYVQRLLDDSG